MIDNQELQRRRGITADRIRDYNDGIQHEALAQTTERLIALQTELEIVCQERDYLNAANKQLEIDNAELQQMVEFTKLREWLKKRPARQNATPVREVIMPLADAELLIKTAMHRLWSYSFAKKCLYIQIYDADTTREVMGIEIDAAGLPVLNDMARSFLRAALAAESTAY